MSIWAPRLGGLKRSLWVSAYKDALFNDASWVKKKLERECGRSSQCKTWFAHIERRSLLGHINFRLRSGGSDWSIAFTWLARDSIFANNSDCKIGPMVLDANKRGGRTSPRWQWLRQEGHESEQAQSGCKKGTCWEVNRLEQGSLENGNISCFSGGR